MPPISFEGLLGVAVTLGAPLVLGLAPRLRVPAVVLEIVAGIVVGPSVLGWIRVDLPISVLSTLGLAFLLFLAGMEIDFELLRGRPLLSLVVFPALALAVARSSSPGEVTGTSQDAVIEEMR